jgi:hypothetical protein
MRQLVVWLVIPFLVLSAAGCGGNVEKNKNKDLDRPKPAAEK